MAWTLLLYAALAMALSGCFTGIESTPRITASDVKKQHITVRAETAYMQDIRTDSIGSWEAGKRFRVTDSKITLVLTSDTPIDAASLVGSELVYRGYHPQTTVMGEDVAVVDLELGSGRQRVYYKTDIPYDQIGRREYFEIPFTVDLDVVKAAEDKMKGQRYYITTPLWYDSAGQYSVQGLRHIEVEVEAVLPGNSLYPVLVVFRPEQSDRTYGIYMTTGSRRTSTRNFDTLFAFDNPRKQYPHISDDDWALITHSRVKIGMNRDECRLALGAPSTIGQRPTRAGMVEYWSYADGVYLLFEDGLLSSYRR